MKNDCAAVREPAKFCPFLVANDQPVADTRVSIIPDMGGAATRPTLIELCSALTSLDLKSVLVRRTADPMHIVFVPKGLADVPGAPSRSRSENE